MAFTVNRGRILKIGVKLETTEGSDPTPAGGTDDLLAFTNMNPVEQQMDSIRLEALAGTLTKPIGIAGPQTQPVNFEFLQQPSGSAGVSAVNGYAAIAAMWLASGHSETIVGATSLTYAPSTITQLATFSAVSPRCGSMTAYVEADGLLMKSSGIWGNMTLTGRPDGGLVAQFSGLGGYTAPSIATYANYAIPANRARAFIGTGLTVTRNGGSAYTPVLKEFRFDGGASTERITDANSSTGLKAILFADRRARVGITIAADKDGSAALTFTNFHADRIAKVPHKISSAFGTTGAGSVMTFAAPSGAVSATNGLELDTIRWGTDGAHRTLIIDYLCSSTTNEGEYSLALT